MKWDAALKRFVKDLMCRFGKVIYTVRPFNHAILGIGTVVIPTKYRRDTAWGFALLTWISG